MQHISIYQDSSQEAFVYIWHNITLDKKYIGYHKGLQNDGYIASSSSKQFWKDFEDQSMEWKREVFFEGTKEECLREEQRMLREVDFSIEKYYNMARGAEVIFTDEVREKIRQHHLGKPSGMLGKKHSEKTREWLSRMFTGRKLTEEWKQKLRKSKKRKPKEEMQAIRIECPHCRKRYMPVYARRWHFDKCEFKSLEVTLSAISQSYLHNPAKDAV